MKISQETLDNQIKETARDCCDKTINFRDLTKTQKMADILNALSSG